MAIDEEALGVSRDYVVTETTVKPEVTVPELLGVLRKQKTTGQVVVHLSQGAIQKVGVVEKTKVTLAEE